MGSKKLPQSARSADSPLLVEGSLWADGCGGDGMKNEHIPLQNGPIAAQRRVIQYF